MAELLYYIRCDVEGARRSCNPREKGRQSCCPNFGKEVKRFMVSVEKNGQPGICE